MFEVNLRMFGIQWVELLPGNSLEVYFFDLYQSSMVIAQCKIYSLKASLLGLREDFFPQILCSLPQA